MVAQNVDRPETRRDLDLGEIGQPRVFLKNNGLAAELLKFIQRPLLDFGWFHVRIA